LNRLATSDRLCPSYSARPHKVGERLQTVKVFGNHELREHILIRSLKNERQFDGRNRCS